MDSRNTSPAPGWGVETRAGWPWEAGAGRGAAGSKPAGWLGAEGWRRARAAALAATAKARCLPLSAAPPGRAHLQSGRQYAVHQLVGHRLWVAVCLFQNGAHSLGGGAVPGRRGLRLASPRVRSHPQVERGAAPPPPTPDSRTSRRATPLKNACPSHVSRSSACSSATPARCGSGVRRACSARSAQSISCTPATRSGASSAACRPARPWRGAGFRGRGGLTVVNGLRQRQKWGGACQVGRGAAGGLDMHTAAAAAARAPAPCRRTAGAVGDEHRPLPDLLGYEVRQLVAPRAGAVEAVGRRDPEGRRQRGGGPRLSPRPRRRGLLRGRPPGAAAPPPGRFRQAAVLVRLPGRFTAARACRKSHSPAGQPPTRGGQAPAPGCSCASSRLRGGAAGGGGRVTAAAAAGAPPPGPRRPHQPAPFPTTTRRSRGPAARRGRTLRGCGGSGWRSRASSRSCSGRRAGVGRQWARGTAARARRRAGAAAAAQRGPHPSRMPGRTSRSSRACATGRGAARCTNTGFRGLWHATALAGDGEARSRMACGDGEVPGYDINARGAENAG
jgi:hypothetical protein